MTGGGLALPASRFPAFQEKLADPRPFFAQRLARKLCVACKESYHPERDEYLELIRSFDPELAAGHGLPAIPSHSR